MFAMVEEEKWIVRVLIVQDIGLGPPATTVLFNV
jgi:hypothetical protein